MRDYLYFLVWGFEGIVECYWDYEIGIYRRQLKMVAHWRQLSEVRDVNY